MKFHQVGPISEWVGNTPNVDVGEEDVVKAYKIISKCIRNSFRFSIFGTNGRMNSQTKTGHHSQLTQRASWLHWNLLTVRTSGDDSGKHSDNVPLHTSRLFIVLQVWLALRVVVQHQ
jgi:hypothetical protein